jgi:amino acid transporter
MKQRVISTTALLFVSISAIIGSGWLFASYYAAITTGPSSLLAWLIGSVAMIVIAFTFAELSAFVPVTGASIRVPRYTHGQFVSFIFAWIIWITYFSLMAVEVQAIIQYGSFFYPGLVHLNGGLTHLGYSVATALMLLVSVINFYSLKWLLRCNNILTVLKLIIPLFLVAVILIAQFPLTHDSISQMTFAPFGAKGVLSALTTSGIIFSFNGFRQATEMAGEARNPQRAIPIAVVGSILICMLIYLALQYAFLVSVVDNHHLTDWQSVKFSGINSPFAVILMQEKLGHFLPILYLGAIIGPFAAALMYGGSGARALYAMSLNGSLPQVFAKLNSKNLPVIAIGINFVMGMALFAPFPGWASMANFLTSLMVLTYIVAPVCLLSLRKTMGSKERYFKLPYATLWCFTAFYICSLLIYWTGWLVLQKLFVGLLVGFFIMMLYRLFRCERGNLFKLDWQASSWVWFFFVGMGMISYCGTFGGKGYLTFGYDFLALAVLSAISVYLSVNYSLSKEEVTREINRLVEN